MGLFLVVALLLLQSGQDTANKVAPLFSLEITLILKMGIMTSSFTAILSLTKFKHLT